MKSFYSGTVTYFDLQKELLVFEQHVYPLKHFKVIFYCIVENGMVIFSVQLHPGANQEARVCLVYS